MSVTLPARRRTARRHRAAGAGTIWYMGAKTRLLPDLQRAIAPLLERARNRRGLSGGGAPVLVDLFTGTGAVAAHFATAARIVANDAQRFSAVLARALLERAPGAAAGLDDVLARGREVAAALLARHERAARGEARFLEAGPRGADLERYRRFVRKDVAGDPEAEARALRAAGFRGAVLTAYYRNVYFGVRQAAALDGLRAAIEDAPEPARTAYLAALLFAASRATSATAHFAQPRPLKKDSEVRTILRRRALDVEAMFAARVRWLDGATDRPFAGANAVHELPYEALFDLLAPGEIDVVYADPPYTRDQYSRFYHVLETLCDLDYPPLQRRGGEVVTGRYPALERRFQSRFPNPLHVEEEFRRVTRLSAERGAALVWSYSTTNGVLFERWSGALDPFRELLGERYRSVEIVERRVLHSGQGDKNHAANEIIAVCTRPR